VGLGSTERPRSGIFGVLPARKLGREPKRGKMGEGEGKEGNASRQNFENRPFDLTCLSAHTKDFIVVGCQNRTEKSRGIRTTNAGFEIAISKLNLVILKKVFSIRLKGRTVRMKHCQSGN